MGVQLQSTDTYKLKVYNKHGNKVEILSEYKGGTEPIDILYHCENHGDIFKTLNAKNVLSKSFQPCKQCDLDKKSISGSKRLNTKEKLYNRLKLYCESKGGILITKEWTTAKDLYEVDCGNSDHPNFFANADSLVNKPQWCPYCCGRSGDFNTKAQEIIESKNGEMLSKYIKATEYIKVRCNQHNYIWDITYQNLEKGRWCPICNLPYSEKVPYDYFTNNNYNIRVQFGFDNLKGKNNELLRYDFGLFDNNSLLGLVEIDDEEHRQNHVQPRRVMAKERDLIKDEYCKVNKIPLIRIEYYHNKKFKDYDWYYQYLHNELKEFLYKITKNVG